jgi:deoxycytidine triphosphate deaminase
MVLSAKEGLTYLLDLDHTAVPQQHGIDLTIKEVRKVFYLKPQTGVYIDRPTCPAEEKVIESTLNITDPEGSRGWNLPTGLYSIYFHQGIYVPPNTKANIIHRSSIARCGGQIYSGEYDAGFKTKNMGAFLVVHSPFFIEEGSRVAQIIFSRVENDGEMVVLYNGQFQNK